MNAKTALNGLAKKVSLKNLAEHFAKHVGADLGSYIAGTIMTYPDRYDLETEFFPIGPVGGLNGPEKAAEEVIADLKSLGFDGSSSALEYNDIATDIARAVNSGATVEQAKDYAAERAIERAKADLDRDIEKMSGRMREDMERMKDLLGTDKPGPTSEAQPPDLPHQTALEKALRDVPLGGLPLDARELEMLSPGLAATIDRLDRARASTGAMETPKGLSHVAARMVDKEPTGTIATTLGDVILGIPDLLTDAEVRALMGTRAYSTPGHPQSVPVRDTVRGFFQAAYPGPARVDATGRTIQAPTIDRPPKAPGFLRDAGPLAQKEPTAAPSPVDAAARQKAIEQAVAVQKVTTQREEMARQQAAAQAEKDRAAAEREHAAAKAELERAAAHIAPTPAASTLGGGVAPPAARSPGFLDTVADRALAVDRKAERLSDVRIDVPRGNTTLSAGNDKTVTPKGGSSSSSPGGRTKGKAKGDHGAEGFVPGVPHPQIVTSAGGLVKNRYGFNVETNVPAVDGPAGGTADTRVICTELVRRGLMEPELYWLDLRFAEERLTAAHVRGYHLWAVPLVRAMRRSDGLTRLVAAPAGWRAREVAYRLGARPRGSLPGKIVRLLGEPLCAPIGRFAGEADVAALYEQNMETVR